MRKRHYFAKYSTLSQEEQELTLIEKDFVLNVSPRNQMELVKQLVHVIDRKETCETTVEELENEIYQSA